MPSGLYLLGAMTETIIEVNGSDGDPWWITAIVAVGAALLGATVGGFASFFANERLERKRRTARAAVRRKAKVYTPTRHELLALGDAIDKDDHLRSGIAVTPPEARSHGRGPAAFRWREMKTDGRALTAASGRVRSALDEVDDAIERFNAERASAMGVIDVRGRELFAAAMGAPTTLVHWVHGDELVLAVRGRIEESHLFSFDNERRESQAAQINTFARTFAEDPRVRDATRKLTAEEARLRASLADAVRELEAAMGRIAARYEGEASD